MSYQIVTYLKFQEGCHSRVYFMDKVFKNKET
jgi:hypothetical protein